MVVSWTDFPQSRRADVRALVHTAASQSLTDAELAHFVRLGLEGRYPTGGRWCVCASRGTLATRARFEPGTRALIAPRFLDIHRISDTHEHIGMIYWARPVSGDVTLATEEHDDIRWCSAADLEQLQPPMSNAVKWYCGKALEEVGRRKPLTCTHLH